MPKTLTERQRDIYEFIVDRVRRRGIPPSLIEIAQAFGLASPSGVADHLAAIERKGYIRRRPGISRGIELAEVERRPDPVGGAVRVPVIGSLPARRLRTDCRAARRHLMFDGRVAPGEAIALRIRVAGLERRGILRGDYVIVAREGKARPGDLAVARLDDIVTLVEVVAAPPRVRRVDNQELSNGYELLGRVVAVLRSMSDSGGGRRGGPGDTGTD